MSAQLAEYLFDEFIENNKKSLHNFSKGHLMAIF